MSLFGRAERRRIDELEARGEQRLARITQLEKQLEIAVGRQVNPRLQEEMAARAINAERQLKEKEAALQTALQRIDDAMGIGPAAESVLRDAGEREKTRIRTARAGGDR